MTERISLRVTMKDGSTKNIDWYEYNSATVADCLANEADLVWYVLESIADDEELSEAIKIDAEEVLLKGSKVVNRITATVRG